MRLSTLAWTIAITAAVLALMLYPLLLCSGHGRVTWTGGYGSGTHAAFACRE